MSKLSCMATLILLSCLVGADTVSERWAKRIEVAEANYQAAVSKANDVKLFAVRKAALERVRVLKSALGDATKGGDFTAATELQTRLDAAESEGAVRPKPKNTVKFGGHEYALINEKATWHVAKKRCEEMGGHLATLETVAESNSLLELVKQTKESTWIGATDEEEEGVWKWVTGAKVQIDFHPDNGYGAQHFMLYWPSFGTWDDGSYDRCNYICEWDK